MLTDVQTPFLGTPLVPLEGMWHDKAPSEIAQARPGEPRKGTSHSIETRGIRTEVLVDLQNVEENTSRALDRESLETEVRH